MGLNYVDIFYHHRPDPEAPLEETMFALDQIIRSEKALSAGISNYSPEQTDRKSKKILDELKTPFIIHQARYSMIDRTIDKNGLLETIDKLKIGLIIFSPLAQGLLSGKYLNGIPENSRAAKFKPAENLITPENVEKVKELNILAKKCGQTLSQMALTWILNDKRTISVLIGASSIQQIEENVDTLKNLDFLDEELNEIKRILGN